MKKLIFALMLLTSISVYAQPQLYQKHIIHAEADTTDISLQGIYEDVCLSFLSASEAGGGCQVDILTSIADTSIFAPLIYNNLTSSSITEANALAYYAGALSLGPNVLSSIHLIDKSIVILRIITNAECEIWIRATQ